MAANIQDFIAPRAVGKFRFDNTYARLPERFYVRMPPKPVAGPVLFHLNAELAGELGLDPDYLGSPEGVSALVGNHVPAGADSLAQAYAGHQFGGFSPQLGDGRALLLGEIIDRAGRRRDIQLKGSGPTPFSRRGDGRAALGPMLRELIIGEALHAHGIPTTRALAVVATGEAVMREQQLPGAVLTRVAASHIRVGTFQYFAARGDGEALRLLADHAIARHDPECAKADNPYLAFLGGVTGRQADLIARWLLIGFIHGVMNTDNMAISGETIDFGPCAFMDAYDPATVYSSIDEMGRYAFANQPRIGLWNLTRLAECLLPLIDADEAKAIERAQLALAKFGPAFDDAYFAGLRRKTGLMSARDDDVALIRDLLELMTAAGADHTLTFRELATAAGTEGEAADFLCRFADQAAAGEWLGRWRARLAGEDEGEAGSRQRSMLGANPLYIPRNHLVEEALVAAERDGDAEPLERLLSVLVRPFDEQPGAERYALPPRPEEVVRHTFCGT